MAKLPSNIRPVKVTLADGPLVGVIVRAYVFGRDAENWKVGRPINHTMLVADVRRNSTVYYRSLVPTGKNAAAGHINRIR